MAAPYKERRILIIGKTGHGKSATANTLLGKDVFSVSAFSSSHTDKCSFEKAYRFSKKLVVIDSPGFFDTRSVDDDIRKELIRICALLSPGFHAVFLVLKPERFTRENQETVEKYTKLFGQEMFQYTFLILTHWDQVKGQVKSLDEYFKCGSPELKDLQVKCEKKCFVLENNSGDERQIEKIIEQMERNLQRFGGKCFSNVIFRGLEQFFHQYCINAKKQKQLTEELDQLSQSIMGDTADIELMMSSTDEESENAYQKRLNDEGGDDERDKLRRRIADDHKGQKGIFDMLIRFFQKLFAKIVL